MFLFYRTAVTMMDLGDRVEGGVNRVPYSLILGWDRIP